MKNVCIPVLRRYDLLRRLLVSLAAGDVQPDAVYILDNGRDAEKLSAATDGFFFPIVVQTPEQNLGVAASWNWFIKNVPSDEWLITNDDMTFAPQSLSKMYETKGDLVFGFGFSCYLMRASCIDKVGLFDEGISPGYAYFEDCDYMERAHKRNANQHVLLNSAVALVNAEGTGLVHGDGKDGSSTYRAGTEAEIAEHWKKYKVAQANFVKKWGAEPQDLEAQRTASKGSAKKRLLWVGDAACPSGFARATHAILDTLRHTYDVTVLGINYNADPHPYDYPIYAAFPGGDAIGFMRIAWMCDRVKPDVIVLQNDGWHIPLYMEQLAKRHQHIPVVAALAVDGKNFNGDWLKGVSLAVFWTQFALDEARTGGYAGPARVITLGVDTKTYHPVDKREARIARKLEPMLDAFVVGNVNRNQVRKRWDLTIRYFAEWVYGGMPIAERVMHVETGGNKAIRDAWLYLHTAPTGDEGVDVVSLAKYYKVSDRLALMTPDTFYGITEEQMRDTYCSFDVQVTTSQGEGFGLTTFEGAACGVAQAAPRWSALGELFDGAALLIPCTSTALNASYSGTIGGVADEAQFIAALNLLYHDKVERARLAACGLARAREERFRWSVIGKAWSETLHHVLYPEVTEEEWRDLGRPKVIGRIGAMA